MKEIYPLIKDSFYKRANTKFYVRHAARAFLFKDNKFCLLHIFGTDAFGKRDHFETPGGGIEKGEDLVTALKREIKEETGYDIKNINEIGKISIEYKLLNRIDVEYYFYAEISEKHETHLLDYEKKLSFEPYYFTIEEALHMYKSNVQTGCGKMIHEREYNALLYLKKLLDHNIIKKNDTTNNK